MNSFALNRLRHLATLMMAFLAACIVLSGMNVPAAFAAPSQQAPTTVAFEGYLADSGGNALSGTFTLKFRLYDAASGGAALWTEEHTSVNVSHGLYSVQLGSVTTFPAGAFDGQRWLSVEVNNSGTEMSPRIAITAVPWALNASSAQGLQGRAVSSTAPSDGQVLVWNATASMWTPQSGLAGALKADGSVAMTGDLNMGGLSVKNAASLAVNAISSLTTPPSGTGAFYEKSSDKRPYFMNSDGTEIPLGAGANIQPFITPGTYTWHKPATGSVVMVIAIGAGGGGGGGRRGNNSTARSGGTAGGGGSRIVSMLKLADIPGDLTVIVGAHGVGGAGGSAAANTSGSAGTAGNHTYFGTSIIYVLAGGGGAGLGGTNGVEQAGGAGGGNWGFVSPNLGMGSTGGAGISGNVGNSAENGGGAGGGTTDTTTAVTGGFSIQGSGGGGGGASCNASNVERTAGVGGGSGVVAGGAAGVAGVNSGAGGAGTSHNNTSTPDFTGGGSGGGGGVCGKANNTPGGNGGAGGSFGGGGGGGGAGTGTGAGGNGGNGADGALLVIVW